MSEPKRYSLGQRVMTDPSCGISSTEPWVYEDSNGLYVKHSDYASIKAEVERLHERIAHGDRHTNTLCNLKAEIQEENERLKAENEKLKAIVVRFRKSLDALGFGCLADPSKAANYLPKQPPTDPV